MLTHAKAFVALATAVAVTLSTFVASDSTAGRGVTVALSVLGALGVYLTPNKPASAPAQSS